MLGSVILQALIGKDGIIQNLRVVSGPRILAGAAEDAVRQWKFKPHFVGGEAVEAGGIEPAMLDPLLEHFGGDGAGHLIAG